MQMFTNLQNGLFPWPTDLQELLQHRSFSQGINLQEETAPAWVPHGTGFLTKTCCLWTAFHGQQLLLQGGLLQNGLSTG